MTESILPRQALLLAGGRGTRVSHFAPGLPKCLLHIYSDLTILDLVIAQLREFGVNKLFVAGARHNEKIQRAIVPNWRNLTFRFLPEPHSGTLNVVKENLNRLPKRSFIVYADTIYLTTPMATFLRPFELTDQRYMMGVGRAFGNTGGNVFCERGYVYHYDKGGVRSSLSDSGYHIIDYAKIASSLDTAKGMLEDGFIQKETQRELVAWHAPVVYLDLGTETSLETARITLQSSSASIEIDREHASKAGNALRVLRERLSVV